MKRDGTSGPTGSSPPMKKSVHDYLLDEETQPPAAQPVLPEFPGTGASSSEFQMVPKEYLQQMKSMLELQQQQATQNQLLIHALFDKLEQEKTQVADAQDMDVQKTPPADAAQPATSKFESIIKDAKILLDQPMYAHIRKTAGKFRTELENMSRTDARIPKLQKELDTLAAGKLPPGMPAFKCPFKSAVLEEVYIKEGDDEPKFEFPLKRGETFLQCKMRAHTEHCAMQCRLDLEIARVTQSVQKKGVTFEKFLDECAEPLRQHSTVVGTLSDYIGDGKASCVLETKMALLEKESSLAYKKLLELVASKRMKDDEAKLKQVELDNRQREAAAKLTPHDVLESYIGGVVDSKLKRPKKKDNIDYGAMINVSVSSPVVDGDEIDPDVRKKRQYSKSQLNELKNIKAQMRSGNYSSPMVVGGHNSPQPKATAKPMAKPKPKRKDKGKGKGKENATAAAVGGKSGSKGSKHGGQNRSKGSGKGKGKKGSGKGKGKGK